MIADHYRRSMKCHEDGDDSSYQPEGQVHQSVESYSQLNDSKGYRSPIHFNGEVATRDKHSEKSKLFQRAKG
jgi:hypothetical protein